jgi:hypothetical protein
MYIKVKENEVGINKRVALPTIRHLHISTYPFC